MDKKSVLVAFLLRAELADPERGRYSRAELWTWELEKLKACAEAIVNNVMQSMAN